MIDPNSYDKLAEPVLKRQEELFLFILEKLAKRLKKIGKLLPSDLHTLQSLIDIGEDINDINTRLADMTAVNIKQINNIIDTVARDAYKDSKKYYDFKKAVYEPYRNNKQIQDTVQAIKKVTTEACYGASPYTSPYVNISGNRAIGVMVDDPQFPKPVFKPLADAYRSVIDAAVQAVTFGVRDYKSAMRDSMTQFTDSGLRRLVWESGYTQRLDTSVRRNLLDGIHKTAIAMQDIVGQQFGADGKEISVHYNSAPDHEPFQGHQLTNEEFEKLQTKQAFTDVKGNKFHAQIRAIGEMNCKHFAYSIIVGFSTPLYTDKQLKDYIAKNNKGYTDKNGKHYTLYECTQKQRAYETNIRKLKEQRFEAQQRGDMQKYYKYNEKVKTTTDQYLAFSKACNLMPDHERIII